MRNDSSQRCPLLGHRPLQEPTAGRPSWMEQRMPTGYVKAAPTRATTTTTACTGQPYCQKLHITYLDNDNDEDNKNIITAIIAIIIAIVTTTADNNNNRVNCGYEAGARSSNGNEKSQTIKLCFYCGCCYLPFYPLLFSGQASASVTLCHSSCTIYGSINLSLLPIGFLDSTNGSRKVVATLVYELFSLHANNFVPETFPENATATQSKEAAERVCQCYLFSFHGSALVL